MFLISRLMTVIFPVKSCELTITTAVLLQALTVSLKYQY